MKLVVGLGNPGPRYETTRHNMGFLAVDRLIDRWKASGPVLRNKGEVYEATFAGEKVLLLKPQTFMNLSGQSVGPVLKFYKILPEDLVVLQDEVDIPPFMMRMKTGGGSGGHNGIKSIDAALGSGALDYHRVRLGIGKNPPIPVEAWVLQQFTDEELKKLDPFLDDAAGAVELILRGQMREAMNRYHRRPQE